MPIAADPADATISGAIPLNDGVAVRFGGHGMRPGDYWTFTTRYLAGDEASGLDPVTRIERLDWQRARGVVHHYAPLAVLVRDGDADDPDKIFAIVDRRLRTGGSSTTSVALPKLTGFAGKGTVHLGGMALPPTTLESKFLVFWSGDLFLPAAAAASSASACPSTTTRRSTRPPTPTPARSRTARRRCRSTGGRQASTSRSRSTSPTATCRSRS